MTFADPRLEFAIRLRLGRPSGTIYASDLAGIRKLELNSQGIHNLSGLEYLTGAHTISLRNNHISDLRPISGLTSLARTRPHEQPDLERGAPYSPHGTGRAEPRSELESGVFSPLATLTDLKALSIVDTPGLGEMHWLLALTGLETLDLWGRRLPNITVSPISPTSTSCSLTKRTSLTFPRWRTWSVCRFWASTETISTIFAPLVANQGLGAGDDVWVWRMLRQTQVRPVSNCEFSGIGVPRYMKVWVVGRREEKSLRLSSGMSVILPDWRSAYNSIR